ncbi:MAG: protease modulator HflK [Verrucomicrobiae bacterium]|nr:protease modulator HflK [Verrucomicrobiae bacterium]MCX7722007.1 protease modulator HflK [Verrucomicrobiae bacterium]
MERSAQKNALVNLLAMIAVGAAGYAAARYAHCLSGQVTSLYMGIGALVALISWFQLRLAEREQLEKIELEELTRTRTSAGLFESKEADLLPARRAREQFQRYFVPGFTLVLFLLEAGGAFALNNWLSKVPAAPMRQPTMAMAFFGLFALVLFLLGKFSATLARLENNALLRPSASFVLLGAYLSFAVGAAIAAGQAGFPKADFYLARALCVLLGVVAAETLISLILEIYRPRVKGQEPRPVYESRLVGLLAQPEGLVTTAAQALDYQFGFKVSQTWVYKFLEKAFAKLLLAQLAVLLLSTCVVFVEPGQQALLERFGKPVPGRQILGPGAHLKFPWPIDKVHLHRTEQVQSFTVGMALEKEKDLPKTVLWTVGHGKEDNFIVASRQLPQVTPTAQSTNGAAPRRSPPVSLLAVNVPVQFQITDLIAWAYNNAAPAKVLENIATREITRYLSSVELQAVMSHGRWAAAETLRQRIQAAADQRRLGVKILFVGLEGVHPPVQVAPHYEKVIGAIQQKQAKVLSARADAIKTNALAEARAFQVVNEASAYRLKRELGAAAQAALFTNQLPAWLAAPSVYMERKYLETFVRASAGARKYALLTTNTQDIIQLDLQDKIRPDLLDLAVPASR